MSDIDWALTWVGDAMSDARMVVDRGQSGGDRLHAAARRHMAADDRVTALRDRLYRIAAEARAIEAEIAALHTERRGAVDAR